MVEILTQFIVTIISGCIVATFTQWLRSRNDKKRRR
ncbi:type I toxin-antitoxin system Fst family toxin [Staphylococcus pettenkoferi]|uniref:Type I toxin-antitoxin system Fst family toxin n=1 Tax=Staphylococcus pettenkoferi TaxID=170573 RepID=A0A9Q4D356_9STAP|nr:type I toxin-antitoxin system Fst family toxin [Staphylococcus pettenkoferi]MCY1569676.1 type I toxin-antitoxin system Fst family toxin [Staphylococcus pettenkoferi]MCY1576056.1 type I toxin-antitoxin system Fst family toxin [Staphylococcus pettenkoferi]MCY1594151.1 type I toxin-antitoxin system Fst family toxin [Staphylococcus pettenkoferi]MCY1617675.1 type I toxin-antitoxin system Fst family toxin [Staphylococcus pettenkoferi]